MPAFTDKQWITTDSELKTLLSHCKNCARSTMNGDFVLPYNMISYLHVPKGKFTMVLNTNNSHSSNTLGHWFCCHIDNVSRIAVLYDSLNEIEFSHPDAVNEVKMFCKVRNLKLHILHFKTQESKNVNCGFHSIWFTHKSHELNPNALLKLKRLFRSYSVPKREQLIMNNVFTFLKF